MRSFAISGTVEDRYKGCGLALAAIRNDRVAALTYIHDVAPDASDEVGRLSNVLRDRRVRAEALRMGTAGHVMAGMCSCLELTALHDVSAIEAVLRPAADPEPLHPMPTLAQAIAAIRPQRHADMMTDYHNIMMAHAGITDATGVPLHPEAAAYRDAQPDNDAYDRDDCDYIA